MKKRKKNTSEIQNNDVLYETCPEDRTNSTINLSTSLLVEEEKNNQQFRRLIKSRTSQKYIIFYTVNDITQCQTNQDLLLNFAEFLQLNLLITEYPFKVPEIPTNKNNEGSNILTP